jgi:AraC family transcriptional activator of tynA and feaB
MAEFQRMSPEETLRTFSTAGLDPDAKISYWNDIVPSEFAPATVHRFAGGQFDASLKVGMLGPVSLASIKITSACFERNENHIKARTERRRYGFLYQVSGSLVYSQTYRNVVVRPGDFLLRDVTVPHSIKVESSAEFITVRIPEPILRAYLPFVEQALCRSVAASNWFCRTAGAMLQSLWEELERGLAGRCAPLVVSPLIGVLATAFSVAFSADVASSAGASARREQAIRLIEENLRDPELTLSRIAQGLEISPRYLSMLFSSERETVADYILRRRLEECACQMVNGACTGAPITELAFSWGFNNASHFARVFKRHFGLAPRDYRQMKLGAQRELMNLTASAP